VVAAGEASELPSCCMKYLVAICLTLSLCSCAKKPKTAATSTDQTVIVSGTAPYSGSVSYHQSITITGLPAGCAAAINAGSTVITISGCGSGPPTPSTVTVDAANPAPVSSGAVVIQGTGDPPIPGAVGANKISFTLLNQAYDYSVNVPVAGNYTGIARLATDSNYTTGGTLTVHFEMPPGTHISGPISLNSPIDWTSVSSSQVVAFPAGTVTVRLVVDALPTSSKPTNRAYIHWFQLVPSSSSPTHSVTLNWTAPPPQAPCTVPCPPPAGSPPCFDDPTAYHIYRTTVGVPPSQAIYATVAAPITTYTDTAVTAGTSYTYHVTSYNGSSCQPESAATGDVTVSVPTTFGTVTKVLAKPAKKGVVR
jgi:hypothetical protein